MTAPAPSPPAPARFPLTRYFVLTGLVTAVIVAAVLAAISSREVRRDLLQQREALAIQLARSLERQVQERFLAPTVAREGAVDLTRPEQLAALDAIVLPAIADFAVERVYFFDLEGRILYAKDHAHIGFSVQPDNENYWRAARGTCSSGVVARGSPLDLDGQPGAKNLLETYVPVYSSGEEGRPPTGVIEIYQDAAQLLEESLHASLRLAAIGVGAIAALMLALWLWIREAERTIDDRTRAMLEANRRLEALSADLERQVEDRTRRLLRAETLATVGTLGAGVAHEVNNPVAAIASCAEGLLRRAESPQLKAIPAFADFPEYLQIVRDEAFRVKAITRNLLDFSRGEAVAREEVDLGQVLQATARLLEHRALQEQKRLELDLGPTPVKVLGDPGGLRQLLLNVSINALDACRAGGRVSWSLRALPTGGAEMACEDDGPGFAPEELARALEPFYSSKPTGTGTGLGLYVAYAVARQHGGEIELGNSTSGRGARVVVRVGNGEEGARGQG